MNNEFVKCSHKTGGYSDTRCDALSSILEYYPKSNSKGVFGKSIVNIETNENLGVMVVMKLGKFQKDGVVMNICPFCGGSLIDPLK